MLDALVIQEDSISKQAADFALTTFAQNLTLTNEQRDNLICLLEEKYMFSGINAINIILNHMKMIIKGDQ